LIETSEARRLYSKAYVGVYVLARIAGYREALFAHGIPFNRISYAVAIRTILISSGRC
jgi:hypothetical protein